jgi:hypothetical protein
VVTYILPTMHTQQTTFNQRSFLLKIYVVSIGVIAFYLALCPWLQPSNTKLLLLITLGSAFLTGYVITLKSKTFLASSHYYIGCLYLVLLINAVITGGIGTPGIIWFLICPLIAFITLSTYFARIWLMVIIATVICLYALEGVLVFKEFENRKIWYMLSYILFFPMVYSIMRIFRKEVSKKNIELSILNEKLKRESDRVQDAESKARERSAKLSYYLDQLIEVKRMEEIHTGDLDHSMQGILQFLFKSMSLDNVAVWRTQVDGQLELFKYLGNGSDVYEHSIIDRKYFPDAFDMLQTGAVINGCDETNEAKQLRVLFRYSEGKDSMINCPYFIEGKFAGFISCRATSRKWSSEDVIFVRAISDTMPLAFKSNIRKRQQELLEEKQREITEINESLERKVYERTIALNKRNKQLTDFAFTNAHHIRGPICRLLGLQNLLTKTNDCSEIIKIADYMNVSVEELDMITRKTSAELDLIVDTDEQK